VEMGRRATRSIWKIEEKDNKSTGFHSFRREGKLQVETNVLGHVIGGVLSQEQDGKWKPIAFLSRTMQLTE